MQITIEIPEIMIANVRGNAVERDMTKLGAAALAHLFTYGFQRVNNDAGAVGKDETDADALAKSGKKWDALVAGTIRVQTGRESDPVMARAMELAIGKIHAAIRVKHGLGPKAKIPEEYDAKSIREKAKKVVADNPKILEQAKASIEAEKALAGEITIEI